MPLPAPTPAGPHLISALGPISEGAAFWIGDVLFLPLTFRVSSGGETVFEKSYGNRSGLTDTISCGTEPNELGFEFEVTAVRVPPAR